MQFNPLNFIENLRYMGVGMLSIFIVIGVIVLITDLLNKVTKK
ncbi:MAG: oxaloacetate decarboxylase [Clostridia bacterium]|nr:oxaloacetate decarboxylase [Clostridia bacterium]